MAPMKLTTEQALRRDLRALNQLQRSLALAAERKNYPLVKELAGALAGLAKELAERGYK